MRLGRLEVCWYWHDSDGFSYSRGLDGRFCIDAWWLQVIWHSTGGE